MNFGTHGFPKGLGLNKGLLGLPSNYEGIWTPRSITTQLWLDASDSQTVTTVSGAVSQITDKSGNNRNWTQSTLVNRPSYISAAQNGLNALRFNGTTSRLDIVNSTLGLNANGGLTIAAVYKPTGTGAAGYNSIFGNFSSGTIQMGFSSTLASNNPWGLYPIADFITGTSYVQNKNYIALVTRSGDNWTGHTDGTQNNTVSSAINIYSSTPSWAIGANTGGGESAQMDLYELVVINYTANNILIDNLTGYFAHKWGLTNNLPVQHPYKSTMPLV